MSQIRTYKVEGYFLPRPYHGQPDSINEIVKAYDAADALVQIKVTYSSRQGEVNIRKIEPVESLRPIPNWKDDPHYPWNPDEDLINQFHSIIKEIEWPLNKDERIKLRDDIVKQLTEKGYVVNLNTGTVTK